MTQARIVSAWYFETCDVWIVEIDGLEGAVKSGQDATFSPDSEVAGP